LSPTYFCFEADILKIPDSSKLPGANVLLLKIFAKNEGTIDWTMIFENIRNFCRKLVQNAKNSDHSIGPGSQGP
jgi:hypothetical protein